MKLIDKYDRMTLDQLNQIVYEGKITQFRQTKSVKDIPEKAEVFSPLPDNEAKAKFEISDSWIETLDILLDEPFYDGLCKALKGAKKGRVYSYDEVFKDV